jgi:hypothetical protein
MSSLEFWIPNFCEGARTACLQGPGLPDPLFFFPLSLGVGPPKGPTCLELGPQKKRRKIWFPPGVFGSEYSKSPMGGCESAAKKENKTSGQPGWFLLAVKSIPSWCLGGFLLAVERVHTWQPRGLLLATESVHSQRPAGFLLAVKSASSQWPRVYTVQRPRGTYTLGHQEGPIDCWELYTLRDREESLLARWELYTPSIWERFLPSTESV